MKLHRSFEIMINLRVLCLFIKNDLGMPFIQKLAIYIYMTNEKYNFVSQITFLHNIQALYRE